MIYAATGDHVNNLEVCQPYVLLLIDFLHCLGIVLCCIKALLFALGTCYHHLAGLEDQSGRPQRVLHAHDNCGKALGVIFRIAAFQSYRLEVQLLAV